jgi:hypothetical protein
MGERGRGAIAERGQGTVEWVGTIAVVALLLAALVAAGVRVPGAGLARAVASRILCAAALADGCGDEPTLIATYGDEIGRLVRRHMPTLLFERGSRALPVDFRRCRAVLCGDGTPRGLVHRTDRGQHVTAFVHVVDCRDGERSSGWSGDEPGSSGAAAVGPPVASDSGDGAGERSSGWSGDGLESSGPAEAGLPTASGSGNAVDGRSGEEFESSGPAEAGLPTASGSGNAVDGRSGEEFGSSGPAVASVPTASGSGDAAGPWAGSGSGTIGGEGPGPGSLAAASEGAPPGSEPIANATPDCSGARAGNLYIQYWTYYADSATLRGVPIAEDAGFHRDDWEGVGIRIGRDGRVDERASSHHGYNYERSVANAGSDAGVVPLREAAEAVGARPRNGWGPETRLLLVSGGSHAGNANGYLRIDRVTPGRRVHLVPLEPIAAAEGGRYRFAISPPWRKRVWRDPEAAGTD